MATTTLSPNRPARKRRTLYGLGNVLNTNISKSDRYIHTKRRDSANSSNGSNATNQQGTCLSLCPNPVQNYIKNFKMKNFLKETASCYGLLKNGEIMSIFIILVFQDGPFLFIRLYLMTEHQLLFNPDGSINQMLLFFTGKNILVILLQLYRIINLCFDRNRLKLENINDLQVNILRSTLKKSIGEDGRFKHSYMKITTDKNKHSINITIREPKKFWKQVSSDKDVDYDFVTGYGSRHNLSKSFFTEDEA